MNMMMPGMEKASSEGAKKRSFVPTYPLISAEELIRGGYKLREGVSLAQANQYEKNLNDSQNRGALLATLMGRLKSEAGHASAIEDRVALENKLSQLKVAYELSQEAYYKLTNEGRSIYNRDGVAEEPDTSIETILSEADEALRTK